MDHASEPVLPFVVGQRGSSASPEKKIETCEFACGVSAAVTIYDRR